MEWSQILALCLGMVFGIGTFIILPIVGYCKLQKDNRNRKKQQIQDNIQQHGEIKEIYVVGEHKEIKTVTNPGGGFIYHGTGFMTGPYEEKKTIFVPCELKYKIGDILGSYVIVGLMGETSLYDFIINNISVETTALDNLKLQFTDNAHHKTKDLYIYHIKKLHLRFQDDFIAPILDN